jgi:putative FmdB family regulatory protein
MSPVGDAHCGQAPAAAGQVHFPSMPLYEYRCRTCDEMFEVRRPMAESAAPASCPRGHGDAVRLLSMFAGTGLASAPSAAGGGCCGGSCGCAH